MNFIKTGLQNKTETALETKIFNSKVITCN